LHHSRVSLLSLIFQPCFTPPSLFPTHSGHHAFSFSPTHFFLSRDLLLVRGTAVLLFHQEVTLETRAGAAVCSTAPMQGVLLPPPPMSAREALFCSGFHFQPVFFQIVMPAPFCLEGAYVILHGPLARFFPLGVRECSFSPLSCALSPSPQARALSHPFAPCRPFVRIGGRQIPPLFPFSEQECRLPLFYFVPRKPSPVLKWAFPALNPFLFPTPRSFLVLFSPPNILGARIVEVNSPLFLLL